MTPHRKQESVDLEKAHKRSIFHHDEIVRSTSCGCFYCCRTFVPGDIREWTDVQAEQRTALCPHCGIDAVIGSASGFPVTKEFLSEMRKRWF